MTTEDRLSALEARLVELEASNENLKTQLYLEHLERVAGDRRLSMERHYREAMAS